MISIVVIIAHHHQFMMMDGTTIVMIMIVIIAHQFMMMDGTVVMVSILMASASHGKKSLIVIVAPIAMDVIAGRGVRRIIGIQVIGFVSDKVALSTFRLLISLVGKWFAMT